MTPIESTALLIGFATLRYAPVLAVPAVSPMAWAPPMIRMVLLLAMAGLTVMVMPMVEPMPYWNESGGLLLAGASELLIGMSFGLAILLPQAGISMAARLADMQAGLSAASLLNPGGQHEPESLLGSLLLLAATVLFFTLDLHVELFRLLAMSVRVLPLGMIGLHLDPGAFLGMVGSSFTLGLMVAAPLVVGLFAIDLAVAYASRSMPQANVYFLALPIKVAVAMLLLAMTLAYAPTLIGRLYQDALTRLPALFGA